MVSEALCPSEGRKVPLGTSHTRAAGARVATVAMENGRKPVHTYIAEEQALFREAFRAFFASRPAFDLCGVTGDTSPSALTLAVANPQVQVLVVGVKRLTSALVQALYEVRVRSREKGIAVLAGFLDPQAVESLRSFACSSRGGCAILLKSTLNSLEEVEQILLSVAEGRIILDPCILEGLIGSETTSALLHGLSPREREVLAFMAQGYSNARIAQALFLDPKTVEHHINNIYNKVGGIPQEVHPRVYVVMQYLRAKGVLPRRMDTDPPQVRASPPAPPPRGSSKESSHPHRTTRLAYPTTPSVPPPVSADVA